MKQRHDETATGWMIGDINGDIHPRHGEFPTREACGNHISATLDGEAQNEYGMDSMFDAVPIPPPREALADVVRHAADIETHNTTDAGRGAARWEAAVQQATEAAAADIGHEEALREVIDAAEAVHDARATELDNLGPERELVARIEIARASIRIAERQRDPQHAPPAPGSPEKPIRPGGDPAMPPAPPRPVPSRPAAGGPRDITPRR